MNKQEVIDLMKSSRSEKEWSANCAVVKAAYNGHYPAFWFEAIIRSGVATETMAEFGATPVIKVSYD